jgi:hypothetical protein
MRRLLRRVPVPALALAHALLGCASGSTDAPGTAAPSMAPAEFGALVARLSEPGGFFPSDNFVSNELSYLHVLGAIRDLAVSGGAYVGVGPDQSFSYIAATRPEIAFIIDIRRDNLLQHLLYKAAFSHSRNRLAYIAFLLGRPVPADVAAWDTASIERIIRHIDSVPPDPAVFGRNTALAIEAATAAGVPLDVQDTANLARIHRAFHQMGLDIRYSNRGRFGFGGYPTWRQLIFESDLDGNRLNYLASEESYQFLRDLERRNLVVPVVGDLSGTHAFAAVAAELKRRQIEVSVLYTSNVEQYLFQQGGFVRFADNVAALPRAANGVVIRSYFRGRHPLNVPGYSSTQLVGRLDDFVTDSRDGGYRSYLDLVMRHILPLRLLPVPTPLRSAS